MTTNVPKPVFTERGFVAPSEADVLAGFLADLNAAFGGGLNLALSTPQGQIASSEAAVVGFVNDSFVELVNQMDPAYNSGRYQDGIARIYFLERNPSQPTAVACDCVGLSGTVIPPFALAQDQAGNQYYAVDGGTIPDAGTISLNFANQVTGPIPCPANTLTTIYQAVPGWDSINNPDAGALGNVVESRADFEARREASVARNARGMLPAIRGEVLALPNVIDCFTAENFHRFQSVVDPQAAISGSISGTTLTVTTVVTGAVAVDQHLSCAGIPDGTKIVSGSGATWTLNHSVTLGLTAIILGAVPLLPNSIYVAVVGGDQDDVAKAIWNKKAPGADYNGNTDVTVYDDSPPYVEPGVAYVVTFERPDAVTIFFAVSIRNSAAVPSNAAELIQNAILAAFTGADGGSRARIDTTILASRYYTGIAALGPWAQITALLLGSTQSPIAVFTASFAGTVMTVTAFSSGTGSLAATQALAAASLIEGTVIVGQTSGTAGQTGTYVISPGGQTLSGRSVDAYTVAATSEVMLANQGPTTSANDIVVKLV